VITPSFESVWPDVEQRLRGLLFRRGLDRASADDIVQEVALRALAHNVTFASAKDLLRWAGPVACNLHIDLVRHRARLLEDVDPERAGTHDVYGEVADRMELQRAFRGIAALRPADREAIIDAVAAEPVVPRTRKEAVRLAVRRHRARSRLIVLMEKLAAAVGGLLWLRRGKRAAVVAAFAPVAVLPIVATWQLPGHAETRTETELVAPVARSTSTVPAAARPRATDVRPVAPPERTRTVRPSGTAPAPRPHPTVGVDGPGGIGVRAHSEDRKPDDKTLCANVPVIGVICSPDRR
jgi:DNA-directed RNA polymerase specialized sigma24 family protein